MVYEGYLSFGGNEIVNSPRAYGLQLTAPCDSGWLRDPGCESLQEILGDTIYTHDNIASAPWYDPSFPESARFYGVYGLGFYGLKDSTRQVQVTEGLASGGVVGSSRKGVLPLRVRASLLAEGDDAMEYGRSWLEAALSPGACGQHGEECGTADVQFFSACPPGRAIVKGFSDWREYARNYMQTPSFEGMEAAGEAVPVYENLFTNPSMESVAGPVEVRRNFLKRPGDAATGTLGWTTYRSTLTNPGGYIRAQTTEDAPALAAGAVEPVSTSSMTPTAPGEVWTLSAELRATGLLVTTNIQFYDAGGVYVTGSQTIGDTVTGSTSTWRVSTVTATAPPTAAYVRVSAVFAQATVTGQVLHMRRATL